jgi:outer membrane protein OmpA-like peptidoglycan-associated protein
MARFPSTLARHAGAPESVDGARVPADTRVMHDRDLAVKPHDGAQPGVASPALTASAPHAHLLQLQRSAGNAAVVRLLAEGRASAGLVEAPPRLERRSAVPGLARQGGGTSGTGTATSDPASAPAGGSRVAELAKRVGSATGLRLALTADPGLAAEIAAYFASGNEDDALNRLMAEAFSPEPPSGFGHPARESEEATTSEIVEKNPTDPTVPLPAERKGDKKLDKGQMKWTLKPVNHSEARCDVDFKPDETKVEAKNVSFGQTVLNQIGPLRAYAGGTGLDPGRTKAKHEPFEEAATKKRVDHIVGSENDPFYGAEWDQAGKKWKQERADWAIGSSTKGGSSTSATMFDTPVLDPRQGMGDSSIEFETVPMVLETRQPLGALKWGFKVKDEENAPLVLTGAEDADCTDAPSASWAAAMDKFYEGKFAEILDDFDIAKADLKPDHKTKLDSIVTKMTANAALKAQLGGAADLTGDDAFNKALSLKRANAARDYLVAKGIDAGRLEVQSYGFDWARVEAAPGTSEGKNRRVQIWLH